MRSDLRGKKPYGAPMLPVRYALNVNENTHPVPDTVRASILESLAAALENINRYPDREFTALRDSLAECASESHHGEPITSDMVWAANGSNEVLQHVLQAFGGPDRSLLGFPPTYSMHSIIAESTGTAWVGGVAGRTSVSPRRVLLPISLLTSLMWCFSVPRTTPRERRCRCRPLRPRTTQHPG